MAQEAVVIIFLRLSCSSFDASWMESCSRRLVAAVSPRPPSTIRGVAARSAVSSAWASTATATREGDGQSAQPRGCIERIGVRGCCREDGSRSRIAACQGGTEISSSAPSCSVDDAALEHARSKVQRFEEALKAMGDLQGPEVDYLRDALKKARQAAQERPLTSQMTECRRFIERSERRLEKINAEREAETVQLEEARNRLSRLEAHAAALPSEVGGRDPPVNVAVELEELMAKLVATELERDEARSARACKRQATAVVREGTLIPESSVPLRLREDFVPMCEEDVFRWIVRPTFKMQRRQAMVTRWPGCATSWELQREIGQHPHRPWCPTQSSGEASFGFTATVASGLERLHTQALCTGSAESVIGQEARQLVSQVPEGFVMMINHGIQVVRACWRPHFWTV